MTINPGKIFNLSVEEYCRMVGRDPKDYEPIAIRHQGTGYIGSNENLNRGDLEENLKSFTEKVPAEAEAVISFAQSMEVVGRNKGGTSSAIEMSPFSPYNPSRDRHAQIVSYGFSGIALVRKKK